MRRSYLILLLLLLLGFQRKVTASKSMSKK